MSVELRDLRLGLVTFEGNLPLSKLFDKEIQKAIRKGVGENLMIPLIVFAYGEKKFITVMYSDPQDYKNGKATISGLRSRDVEEFYAIVRKALTLSGR